MINLITAALTVIGGGIAVWTKLIKPRCKPTAKQLTEKKIHAARTAVAEGNTEKVNAIIERNRIQKQLILPIAACLLLTGCTGCSLLPISWQGSVPSPAPDDLVPQTIVIPADRYVHPITNDVGIVGWFVPKAVYSEMVEGMVILDYYRQNTKKGNTK